MFRNLFGKKKTEYQRLMEKHDYYITEAIKTKNTTKQKMFYALAQDAKAQAMARPILEAIR